MLCGGWYNKQEFQKNWQSYTRMNRETTCVEVHPFRIQPFRGINYGLIPVKCTEIKRRSDQLMLLSKATHNLISSSSPQSGQHPLFWLPRKHVYLLDQIFVSEISIL